MNNDFVNVVALVRENLAQGNLGSAVFGSGVRMAFRPFGKVLKE